MTTAPKGRPLSHGPTPDVPAVGLAAAILRNTPRLPGAACRSHVQLFDRSNGAGLGQRHAHEIREARREAKAICAGCISLSACADWIDSLRPAHRPGGVAAGQVVSKWKSPAAQQNPEEAS